MELVSIVLPVYDQADHIGAAVDDYRSALDHVVCQYELILVSNGCHDDSPEVCRALARRDHRVRAFDSARGGWGLGVRLGLREARGGLVAYTNSARTTGGQLAALVLQALLNPHSVVKATRVGRSGLRKLGSGLYNRECRLLHKVPCRDVNGTPKVFPREFSRLFSLTRDDDLIDLEFLKTCRRENHPVLEVPIFAGRRHGGDSTTRLSSARKLYLGAYRMWRDERS